MWTRGGGNLSNFFLASDFEIILDFWESYRNSKEFPYTLCPASPNVNILHTQSKTIKTKKLTMPRHHSIDFFKASLVLCFVVVIRLQNILS